MSTRQRVQRIREEIKRAAAEIIRNMKDPRIGFVSVTDVEVSNDLSHVKIFVSVLGDDEAKARTLEGLQAATGFVRTEIGRAVRMRHTPEIVFRLDSSLERGARINQLLAEISSSSDDETAQGAEDPE
ncbi:MAG: 30S ribosome-binding factor RbfA [Firmicutes bacterium]|nr:30S ribosome-binding factor RbfA [Bacillota bacterium]